jgi:hypothetical protein
MSAAAKFPSLKTDRCARTDMSCRLLAPASVFQPVNAERTRRSHSQAGVAHTHRSHCCLYFSGSPPSLPPASPTAALMTMAAGWLSSTLLARYSSSSASPGHTRRPSCIVPHQHATLLRAAVQQTLPRSRSKTGPLGCRTRRRRRSCCMLQTRCRVPILPRSISSWASHSHPAMHLAISSRGPARLGMLPGTAGCSSLPEPACPHSKPLETQGNQTES